MNMLKFISPLALTLFLGCASSETHDSGAHDMGMSDDTATSGDTAAVGEAAVDAVLTTEPKAPTISMLMKMSGAFHVMWKNNQVCDSVIGERKTDTTEYKVLFTVPGTVNNKMDGTATADMTFTYRLRCKVGTTLSPYSAEMSGNPAR